MSGISEGLHGLGDGPERRSSFPDRARFLHPGDRSESTQSSIEERNSRLDKAFEKGLKE